MRFRIRLRLISTHHRYRTASGENRAPDRGFRKGHVTGILMSRAHCDVAQTAETIVRRSASVTTSTDLTERDADAFRESVDENWWSSKKNGVTKRIDCLWACCFDSWYAKSAGKFLIFQPFHGFYFWYSFFIRNIARKNKLTFRAQQSYFTSFIKFAARAMGRVRQSEENFKLNR